MTVNKMLAASVVAALTLSSAAVAAESGRTLRADDADAPEASPEVNASRASCSVVALGYSEVSNTEAIASVSADAAAYICNGEGSKTALQIADDTASAFALAVATASVSCELEGDASVHVDASASAVASATIWVAAYADAFAGAGDCDNCDAYAASFGYIEQEVFLKAVAEAGIKLSAYTYGGRLVFDVLAYQAQVKQVVVTAFASALAAAAEHKQAEACLAWVNAGGCIWTPDSSEGPDWCFFCKAGALGAGAIEEIDAVSDAYALAAAWSCGHSVSIAELEVTAKALAKASAIAISYVYASCKVEGAFACAIAGSEVTEAAEAVAYAYSELWAGALGCTDECNVNVDATAEAIGTILVKASTDAYAVVCEEGNGDWTVEQLAIDIEAASLCALAEASAIAISIKSDTCLAGGIVYASATEGHCPPPAH